MRGDEYIAAVTAGLLDVQAAEVRRELRSHLDEALAEGVAAGLAPDAAEAAAVERMGPVELVARELAVTHHQPWPWRLYLSLVPLCGLVSIFLIWHDAASYARIAPRWLVLLAVCLFPNAAMFTSLEATLSRPGRLRRVAGLLGTDAAAKVRWLGRQPLRQAALVGGITGALSGFVWALVAAVLDWWGRYSGDLVQLLVPLTAGLLTVVLLRRLYRGHWGLVAVAGALAFPLGFLPAYGLWMRPAYDWVFMTLFFQVICLLVGLLLAWSADWVRQHRRSTSST